MLPKIYRIKHPRTPFRVIFTDPAGRRIQRHFKEEVEAKTYHRDLLKKAQVGGTAGLVLDAEMRAEYFAARQALGGTPIMDAVRYYLSHRPTGLAGEALVDVVALFLKDRRRIGRAERTIKSLESTLGAFLAKSPATRVADFTREAVTSYLDALENPPLTIRNHRVRLATLGDWLARRQYLPENPVRYVEVAKHDLRPPRILTPEEARRVMSRAKEYRDGLFAGTYALALYAGLRHGEIVRLTWEDVRLDDQEPIIRVGRGKIRGRRAVRIVPILPVLREWLLWVRKRNLPLVSTADSRKVREVVEWQEDVCRHSWISYRLAMVKDENQVAREAGNSPDVIYRHYFQIVPAGAASEYFKFT